MTNSVYFDSLVGGNGSTVTDDSNALTGLDGGGHVERFVPALSQVVAVAKYVVDFASDTYTASVNAIASASAALSSKNAAAISEANAAQSALDAAAYVGGANSLQTTGSPVVVNAASPPTVGQVLKATSSTNAKWQDVEIPTYSLPNNYFLTGVI